MADIAVVYTLTTPGGTITFNDGGADQFYITEIQGLGSAPIRTPIDNAPQAHGGLVHDFWKAARNIVVEGVFLITSVPQGTQCQALRNDMEEDLRAALESILQADGTLAWTPTGLTARSLTVRHSVPLECPHQDNYLLRAFNFGLVAADPDW
jgi:hypothetical protein